MDSSSLWGLALNPSLPTSLLAPLLAVADERLRALLARRPDLSVLQAQTLFRAGDRKVVHSLLIRGLLDLRAVAESPHRAMLCPVPALPADLVVALSHDPATAAGIARHQRLPAFLAAELSRHPDRKVRKALAHNTFAPPAVLARLSREPAETDSIACALAANPATPADVAETLAGHESFAVRQLVARRTDLPVETYEQLAADTTRVVRRHLAANSAVPEHLLRALATDEEMRDDLLDNPALPLDLLIAFAAGLTPQLLPRIAAATESELRSLASSALRPLVAVRPDLPSALLDELVADPALAEVVVTNRALTGAQVRQLADRHGPRLHLAAAQHPNCPPDLLHQLARSGSEEVRGAIAVHSASPAEALSLCLGGGVATRRAVARHPNLPPETIVELLAGEETVSAAANPSLPISVMEDLLSSE